MKQFYIWLKGRKDVLGAYLEKAMEPFVYEVRSEEEATLARMMLGRDVSEDGIIAPVPPVIIKIKD